MRSRFTAGILLLLTVLLSCGVQNKNESTANSPQSASIDTTIINCMPKILENVPEEIVRFKSGLSEEFVYDIFVLKKGYTSSLIHIAIDSTKSVRKTYLISSNTFDLKETEEKPISLDSLDFRSGSCEVIFKTSASDRCTKQFFIYKQSKFIYDAFLYDVACSDVLQESVDLKNIKQLKKIW